LTAQEAACPGCGVLSARVHQVRSSRLRDIPVAGWVEVVLVRRRFVCAETRCAKRTFAETTEQVPSRAKATTRLRAAVLEAVICSGRAVLEVAAAHGIAWWTVQACVNAAALVLPDVDGVAVRFYRDGAGAWKRREPWMTTQVRQRVIRQRFGRRGRRRDAAWANRRLPLRAGDTLSARALARLRRTFRADHPTDELGAAWGVKERLRRVLACSSLAAAHTAKMRQGTYVLVANTAETDRLWDTICTWWPQIEVAIVTGVTNARTEAANTAIKHPKRTGRGFRNESHYKARILLRSAARTAA